MAIIKFPPDIEPLFSGHETFPLRQLWLLKAFSQIDRFEEYAPIGVFTDEDAIQRFGVGKNMVTSIRHWAVACDVIQNKNKDGISRGKVGEFLFGKHGLDKFIEKEATVWLIHWLLAGRARRSATWYVVFNFIQSQTFTSSDVLNLIQEYSESNKAIRSKTTLERDVETCLKSYTVSNQKGVTEDSAEPLLSDLGLISSSGKDTFYFHRGPQYSLPDEVFVFALLDYWNRWETNNGSGQHTLSFNAIAHDYGSPGRVFKLDEDSVGDRLSRISETTNNYLQWTDSSGIRQVSRRPGEDVSEMMYQILRGAYVK